jgi:hypothetical protein
VQLLCLLLLLWKPEALAVTAAAATAMTVPAAAVERTAA